MGRKLLVVFSLLPSILFAQGESAVEKSWLNKAKLVIEEGQPTSANHAEKQPQAISIPDDPEEIEPNAVSSSTLSLIRKPGIKAEPDNIVEVPRTKNPPNDDKPAALTSVKQPQFKKDAPKPQAPKSNVDWIDSVSGNFNIKIERRTTGIVTPNLAMKFETVYQILRKNISWMMGGKTSVYVYQSKNSFLRNEPVAKNWSGAFFSPSENRIAMYDEPGKTNTMIQQFMHELTHLFVENFFNPPDKAFKLEPPIWLNEGLAVNMEDIAVKTAGNVWASDLIAINILSSGDKKEIIGRLRAGQSVMKDNRKTDRISSKTVSFINFADFIRNESYDIAAQKGDVENWYFQAYAMVRFLFKPYNASYPEKRMQFEQFTKLMATFSEEKDSKGKPLNDANGKIIMKRTSTVNALRKAYGFRDIKDFETQFWKWLRDYQSRERAKILKELN